MLKNKFKIITLLLVIILSITFPLSVLAHNETDENTDDVVLINEEETTSEESTEIQPRDNAISEDKFKRSDIYLIGKDITIDYIVDGNLFVIADNVTINSQIGGDAFICAKSITIGEQGYIFSNLFSISDKLEINGVVYDLYTISQNLTINGYIYRDIRVGSNTINIFGTVGRNAFINCSNINFVKNENTEEETTLNSQGLVAGNLDYSAKKEVSIPEQAVYGEINFKNINNIQNYIMSLGNFVITVIIVWLLCLWLAPKFLEKTSKYLTTKKVLPVIGFGILTPIVLAALSVAFIVLGLTSTIGLFLTIISVVLIVVSTPIFTIALNNVICNKLKIQKKIVKFGILILFSIILWAILWAVTLIPYAGFIINVVMKIIIKVLGIGIIASSIILKEKIKKEIVINEE